MKTIPTALQTDIQRTVASMTVCITITRADKQVFRITNHDTDIVYNGATFNHTIPFVLSAIQSGSDFAVDNTDMTLQCDEVVFNIADFRSGAFDKAKVEITLVSHEDPSLGGVILRTGWFGPIVPTRTGKVTITILGLTKIFDFRVGRRYQPSCDADLGDARCKVAVRPEQAFHEANSYRQGEWFYYYDKTVMTAIPLTNPGFEADGARTAAQAITGWTKSTNAKFIVATVQNGNNAYAGTYALFSGEELSSGVFIQSVHQDLDLVSGGISATDIDDGKISFVLYAAVLQDTYLLDRPRIQCEVLDASGDIVFVQDTGYFELDVEDTWRGRVLAFPLVEGARTVRVTLFMRKTEGNLVNVGFDAIETYWYDHTTTSPDSGVIHQVARLVEALPDNNLYNISNPGFEAGQSNLANSNVTTIPSWLRTSSADWWEVSNSALAGQPATDGTFMLKGGDDSSGVQKTYTLSQTRFFYELKIPPARVLVGAIVGKFQCNVIYGDADSDARVLLMFYDNSNTLLSTVVVCPWGTQPTAPVTFEYSVNYAVPVNAVKMTVQLEAKSPVAASLANIGFDNFRNFILDALRPDKNDLLGGGGFQDDVFATAEDEYTWTGNLVLRAHSAHRNHDVVASVTSRREFTGTNITGGDGTYETALIRWLSGNNAGQTNLVRVWTSGTKTLKLYFPCTGTIQVGDRFEYTRSCQKRFTDDCQLVFRNAVNFRGFPHLPGKLQ